MHIIMFVKPYLTKYRGYLCVFILLSFVLRGLSIFFPYLTGHYIDILIRGSNYLIVSKIVFIIISTGIINISLSYIQRYLNVKIQMKFTTDLIFDILNHLVRVPIRYYDDKDSGYLNHRINSDSNVVVTFLLDNLLNLVTNILTIIILLYISFTINFKITLILLPVFPLYVFLYCFFRKSLYERNFDLKEHQNMFFSKLNQNIQNMYIIKVNATFEESHKIIENSFNKMFQSLLRHTRLSLFFSNTNSFTMVVANGLIFFFCGKEVISGNMSVGEFTIINSYFSMILGSISYFFNFGDLYQKSLVSYNRLKEMLDVSKEINGCDEIANIDTIKLENLSFTYNQIDYIIKGFNQEFNKGKVYFIIGKNGTGKSTLINLILGIYNDYYTGNIYYNSTEIKKLDMYRIRKKFIGVSLQEPKTVNLKLLDNIKYGIESYNFEQLQSLLNKLDFNIKKFTKGMETVIDENSSNISGGQKLKISLIRNFLKEPEVLILDEPTSALDIASIKKLKDLIIETKQNRITIIISHDFGFIDIADEVIDLSIINNFEMSG